MSSGHRTISWVQPVLTSNGTLGGDSFACIASNEYTYGSTTYYAHLALDANNSTNWLTGTYSNTDLPIYLIFYNPEPLNVTSISVANRGTYNTYATEGNVYASNDGNSYILLRSFTNSVSGTNNTWTIDLSSNSGTYKYYKLEITAGVWDKSKTNGMGISELQIIATQEVDSVISTTKHYNAIKCTEKKYYKILPWTQPSIPSNGTLGGDSFAIEPSSQNSASGEIYYAWHAFNDDVITSEGNNAWRTAGNLPVGTLHHIIVYNPNPLKVDHISYTNFGQTIVTPRSGDVYGSNDGSTWVHITSYTNSTYTSGATWNINVNSTAGYKYHKITFLPDSNAGYIWCAEIRLIAVQYSEATSTDYNYVETVQLSKVDRQVERKYYKYVDQVWANPIMTAQIDPGGTEFAAFMDSTYSTRYAYHMFDGQTRTGKTAQTQGTLPHYLGFYNPDPVRIIALTFNWVVATSVYYSPRNGQLEASNDGTNWITLQTFSYPSANPATISFTNPSDNYYKYYRLYGTDGGKSTVYACTECTVSGYIRTGIEEATEQDYDFYKDVETYRAIVY